MHTETPATAMLPRPDGAKVAYHAVPGKSPGVVFLHGLKSDMTGGKALFLEEHCRRQGRAFVRFDTYGHGASSGAFEDGTIGRWTEDAVAVLDEVTQGPQVLVGSSMGGWVMLLAALRRPERVAGLVGIAAAPDFTEDLMWREFSDAQRQELLTRGRVEVAVPEAYGGGSYGISRRLIEEARDHLLLRGPIAIDAPVRLIHGIKDADVPWGTALEVQERLTATDVETVLIKAGDHRLSEPHDLDRLARVLDGLMASIR